MYIDETNLYATAQSEPLPVDHEYSWSTQGALDAAAVRRVGYGLEVGRSVRTAGGTGHIVSPRAQLIIIYYYYYYSVNCRQQADCSGSGSAPEPTLHGTTLPSPLLRSHSA